MDPRRLSESAHLLRLSTLGITFVLCSFVGAGLGWLAHRQFGWGGWCVMAGLFFGIASGVFTVQAQLKPFLGKVPGKGEDR